MVYIFTLIFAFCIALSSCVSDKENGMNVVDVPISFNPAVKINSRVDASAQYPEDVPFGVWALKTNGKRLDFRSLQGAQWFMENACVRFVDEEWCPVLPMMWPVNTQLVFFVYSPFSDKALFSKEKGVIFREVDLLDDQTEYMFSDPISDCERELCGGLVPVPFMRALSRVEFRVRSAVSDDLLLNLKGLSIENVAFRGDFASFPSPHWTLGQERTAVEFCAKEMRVGALIAPAGVRNVMPQAVKSKVKVMIDVCDANGRVIDRDRVLWTDLNAVWKPGQYLVYTLNIGTDKVVFTTDILE